MSVNPIYSTTEPGEGVVGLEFPEKDEYFEEVKPPSSMVLPPPPTMPELSTGAKGSLAQQDGLAFILSDHDYIREIMNKYEFEASTLEDRILCVNRLTAIICQHMYIEEKLVYPILRSRVQGGEFIYERLLLDDLQTKEFLILAEKFSPNINNRVEYDKLISKMIKNELEHIQEEEDVMIPLLEQVMSFHELDKLCRDMIALKTSAPTRPQVTAADFSFGSSSINQQGTGQMQDTAPPSPSATVARPVKFYYTSNEGEVKETSTTVISGTTTSAGSTANARRPRRTSSLTNAEAQNPKSILKHLSVSRLVGDNHYTNSLAKLGVHSIWDLIHHCKTTGDTFSVHQKTGISIEEMVRFVHRADLMRVRGIGLECSELLVLAGVKSVRDLAHRDAEELGQDLYKLNEKLRILPTKSLTLTAIQNWIVEASFLPAIVEVY